MIRYAITVDGRVQCVGFRYFTLMLATNLNLTGYCKNLYDGKVEMEVQGTEKDITQFILSIKEGNGFSRIDFIDVNKIPVIEKEKRYSIKY